MIPPIPSANSQLVTCIDHRIQPNFFNFFCTAQLTSFIDYFTDRLSLLNVKETTVVCGDFNINLLSINSNEHYNAFFADILSSSFLPTITLPDTVVQ